MNTYESEYKLVLKYCWPKQGMHKVEPNQWLGNNQTGGRKNFCAVETGTIDQLIIETHRLTNYPVVEDVSQGCIINLPRGNTKW